MKSRPRYQQRQAAFSLLELMTAMTISMILLGILSYALSSTMRSYTNTRDKVISDREAEIALDYLIRDLESMIAPSRLSALGKSVEVLKVSPDPDLAATNAHWLTLLSMTNDLEADVPKGMDRAISYRIGYQDPIDGASGSGVPEYALYRKVLTAGDTFQKILGSADPRSEVWENEEIVPEITPVEDYLSANVVDLRVRFLANGARLPENDTQQLTIRSDGVFGNGTRMATTITGAEVALTILSKEGVGRLRDGVSLTELISRHGRVYTRQTSVFIRPLL